MGKRKLTDKQIERIVDLYFNKGRSKVSIARRFHIDHTTVIYHLRRYSVGLGIVAKEKQFFQVNDSLLADDDEFFPQKFHPLKTYEDYQDEEEVKRLAKQAVCIHLKCLETLRCQECGRLLIEHIVNGSIIKKEEVLKK